MVLVGAADFCSERSCVIVEAVYVADDDQHRFDLRDVAQLGSARYGIPEAERLLVVTSCTTYT